MIVQHFLKWSRSADVAKRAAAASALGRAYLKSEMSFDERCGADAAMTLLLDDPSPKVRLALADAIAASRAAPPQVITALAADQYEVASLVIARSPILRDADLIARTKLGESRIQRLIAERPEVSNAVAVAICEHGDADAVTALLSNHNAEVCDQCREIAIGRLASESAVRGALLNAPDLVPVHRLRLLEASRQALAASPLVKRALGETAAERVTEEAASSALVLLASGRMDEGVGDLISAMRVSGALTTKLLIRAICTGKVDFVARALADLSGQSYKRVTAILVAERDTQLRALLSAAGLSASVHGIFASAVRIWRDVANGRLEAGAQEVTRMVMEEFDEGIELPMNHANDDIIALLRSIYLDMMRQNARRHALDLAAA